MKQTKYKKTISKKTSSINGLCLYENMFKKIRKEFNYHKVQPKMIWQLKKDMNALLDCRP